MNQRPDKEPLSKNYSGFAVIRAAAAGISYTFRTQRNFRIHICAAIGAVICGILFGISPPEWGLIIIAITMVIVTEILNTSIEKLVDFVSPGFNDMAGKIKDLAAGAVLVAACGSAAIGVFVFGPYLLKTIFHTPP